MFEYHKWDDMRIQVRDSSTYMHDAWSPERQIIAAFSAITASTHTIAAVLVVSLIATRSFLEKPISLLLSAFFYPGSARILCVIQ